MLPEQRLNSRTLHALAAPVNEPHLGEALLERGFEIVFHHVQHVARLKAVQVDRVFDLENRDRLGVVFVRHAVNGSIADYQVPTAATPVVELLIIGKTVMLVSVTSRRGSKTPVVTSAAATSCSAPRPPASV